MFSIGTKVEMERLESQYLDGKFDPLGQGIPSTNTTQSPQPPTVDTTTQGKRRKKNGMYKYDHDVII